MEKKEAIVQMLMKGLTKTQANRFASFIVDFYEAIDPDNIKPIVKPRHMGAKTVKLNESEIQLAETLQIKISKFIESTGYNFKIPEVLELGNAIRMLHTLNKKSYKEIEGFITYLYEYYQPNSSFDWRMQVRSGVAFRKHYENIMASASQDFNFTKSRQIEDVK